MGSAADELLRDFDDHARRVDRQVKDDEEKDRQYHEQSGREGRTAGERLMNIMRGEKPTRETNEEYRKRKEGEAAKDLKKKPSNIRHIVVRG